MDENTIIKAEGVYKKFSRSLKRSMLYGSLDLTRNLFGIPTNPGRLRKAEFWALEDVSFELKRGETLGILGLNGSGKSTLLRVISGILPPDRGKVTVNGSIGSLIAVGAGFHPQMSGRENIFLNGTILGMTGKEIKEQFENIVDFAEIRDFLDAPVSSYSSGMRVRLGFAIAVHCHPDILLVDEVLSVGDITFRNKSLRRMKEFREKANAVVFVSHDIEQTRVLCDKVMIMDHGKIIYIGETHDAIAKYEAMSREKRIANYYPEQDNLPEEKIRRGLTDDGTINILEFTPVDQKKHPTDDVKTNEPLNIYCKYKLNKTISSLSFYVTITREGSEENVIQVISNDRQKETYKNMQPGTYEIICEIKDHHLGPGVYNHNITFRNDDTFETYKKIYTNKGFKVRSDNNDLERGVIFVKENWDLKKVD